MSDERQNEKPLAWDMECRRIEHPHGFLVWRLAPGDTVEIVDIEVRNEHRREGVGRAMVLELCKKVSPNCMVYAITRPTNRIALEFYRGLNFELKGALNNFYAASRNVDALIVGRRACDIR